MLNYILDRFLAGEALRTEESVVVILAVRLAVLLVEVVRTERLGALRAGEALRVVVLAHCCDEVVLRGVSGNKMKERIRKEKG